jgi:hypothetical protein
MKHDNSRGRTPEQRFFDKIKYFEDDVACWVWKGAANKRGYGNFFIRKGVFALAHRWSWEFLRGEIPAGLKLDHLCRTPRCVNPWHLDPVTQSVNLHRGDTIPARNRQKTHCKYGHSLVDADIRPGTGWRECVICKEITREKRKARNRV